MLVTPPSTYRIVLEITSSVGALLPPWRWDFTAQQFEPVRELQGRYDTSYPLTWPEGRCRT